MVAARNWVLIIASAVCVSAYAVPNEPCETSGSSCGASADSRTEVARQSANEAIYHRQAINSTLIPVDVYMQILSTDGTEEGGNISDEIIAEQLKILDEAFEPVGFRFNLVETIRTINAEWYRNLKIETPYELEVPRALRKGDNSTLNIYTIGAVDSFDTAWGTVPSDLLWRPEADGVYQNGTVFLGGSNPMRNKGTTLVHEVGHWFGLYHIFSYNCEMSYDYISDTPLELSSVGGCEVGRDSCPDQPGLDLIHNYMSYSDDSCRNSWTPMQIKRMREQVAKYRGLVYPGIDVDSIPEDNAWDTQYIDPSAPAQVSA